MKPLKILVTGASGFIGQHVVRHLAGLGHQVTALDFRPPANPFPKEVRFHHCDIRTGEFPDQDFDAVVHLAALAGVRPSIDRPLDYEATNLTGTIRLLEFCRHRGIRQFVFASSSSIYGDNHGQPSAESDPANPLSPYALTRSRASNGANSTAASTASASWRSGSSPCGATASAGISPSPRLPTP